MEANKYAWEAERLRNLGEKGKQDWRTSLVEAFDQGFTLARGWPGGLIGPSVWASLVQSFEYRHVDLDAFLFQEGDQSDYLAILLDGSASVGTLYEGLEGEEGSAGNVWGDSEDEELAPPGDDDDGMLWVRDLAVFDHVGSLAVLGVREERVSSVKATTPCGWAVIDRMTLWLTLGREFPEVDERLVKIRRTMAQFYQCNLFRTCHPLFCDELVSVSAAVFFQADDCIMAQEELGSNMAILLQGSIAVCNVRAPTDDVKETPEGREILSLSQPQTAVTASSYRELPRRLAFGIVRRSKPEQRTILTVLETPGSVLGELAALGVVQVRSASAFAQGPVVVTFVEATDLWRVLGVFTREHDMFMTMARNHMQTVLKNKPIVVPEFEGFSVDFWSMLRTKLKPMFVRPGEVVCEQDTMGTTMYVVQEGRFEVLMENVVVGECQSPENFGMPGVVLDEWARIATVRSLNFGLVHALERDDFVSIAQKHPEAALKIKDMVGGELDMLAGVSEYLNRLDAFRNATMKLIRVLSRVSHCASFMAGEYIVEQGDPAASMHVFYSGSAVIECNGVAIGQAHPGNLFGEISVLGLGFQRQTSIRALSLCRTIELHYAAVQHAIRKCPEAADIFKDLAKKRFDESLAQGNGQGYSKSLNDCSFLFRQCSRGFRSKCELWAERKIFFNGDIVVAQGEEGTEMFVVAAGCADVEVNGVQVGAVKEGDCFGDLAALGIATTRLATVRAKQLISVCILGQELLEAGFAEFPEDGKMFRTMALEKLTDGIVPKGALEQVFMSQWPFLKERPETVLQLVQAATSTIFEQGTMLTAPNVQEGPMSGVPDGCIFAILTGVLERRDEVSRSQQLSKQVPKDILEQSQPSQDGPDPRMQEEHRHERRMPTKTSVQFPSVSPMPEAVAEGGAAGEAELVTPKEGLMFGKLEELGVDRPGEYLVARHALVKWLTRNQVYRIFASAPWLKASMLEFPEDVNTIPETSHSRHSVAHPDDRSGSDSEPSSLVNPRRPASALRQGLQRTESPPLDFEGSSRHGSLAGSASGSSRPRTSRPNSSSSSRRMSKPLARGLSHLSLGGITGGAELERFREHLRQTCGSCLNGFKKAFGAHWSQVAGLSFSRFLELCGEVNFPCVPLWKEISTDGTHFSLDDLDAAGGELLRSCGNLDRAVVQEANADAINKDRLDAKKAYQLTMSLREAMRKQRTATMQVLNAVFPTSHGSSASTTGRRAANGAAGAPLFAAAVDESSAAACAYMGPSASLTLANNPSSLATTSALLAPCDLRAATPRAASARSACASPRISRSGGASKPSSAWGSSRDFAAVSPPSSAPGAPRTWSAVADPARDGFTVELSRLFGCGSDLKRFYNGKGRPWVTDHSVSKGPGIPKVLPPLPSREPQVILEDIPSRPPTAPWRSRSERSGRRPAPGRRFNN